ncbi:DUF2807 domain-containing protein [Halosquirtibacter laminarini]|uniref:DUF2807 domain-containing protein n=1 Tax=Halosquirtibacter laminarini TaxID=3374600 RepID=A0AC61ND15_9BACT|nr:DUF2807 domain-containing protein [Prolixibacteraceae bacterium]
MNKIFLFLALITLCSCATEYTEGKGPVVEAQKVEIDEFDQIIIHWPYKVELKQGDISSVAITSEQNIIDLTNKKVVDGVWDLKLPQDDYRNITPVVYITIPNVSNITTLSKSQLVISPWDTKNNDITFKIEGGRVIGKSPFMAKNIHISTTNVGEIAIPKITSDSIFIHSDNSREISLQGTANYVHINQIGNGTVNMPGVKADTVIVNQKNASKAIVYANKLLDITIDGYGKVKYYGGAEVKENINGNGIITKG